VDHYNNVRLNSATGYITPKDMLAGRQQEIHAERDRKLEEARSGERCQPPPIRIIAVEQTGCIADPGAARKYKPDTVCSMQVEDSDMSLVFLRAKRPQRPGVEERWSIPFDFLANVAVRPQNHLP
jgi:hypothetical protein